MKRVGAGAARVLCLFYSGNETDSSGSGHQGVVPRPAATQTSALACGPARSRHRWMRCCGGRGGPFGGNGLGGQREATA
jgi:hypothetical protein